MQSGSKTLLTTINIFRGAFWGDDHFFGEVPPKCPICSTVCSNINICCSCNFNAGNALKLLYRLTIGKYGCLFRNILKILLLNLHILSNKNHGVFNYNSIAYLICE